ncbi:hypothetical protein [Corynebacterium freiburgense]|uniref:hypothetical protein n=1 Tax=Corynebacterium freiburgense TaxID=556548 RepID=UPI000403DFBE|nr:hypothetical protein [Corynebacterium freiburgense]WJZ01908.1 hypothetical protein CFREI_03020 [Corynebacterium freiburgense]
MDLSYSDGSRYDPEIVRFFDVAHTGAHVRALAQYIEAGELADLEGMMARSVILLSESAEDAAVARLVLSTLQSPCPVVVTAELPLYTGPLDILLVATDGSLRVEERATAAMSEAMRRGARTILVQGSSYLRDESPAPYIPVPPTAGPEQNPIRLAYALFAILQSLAFDKHLVAEELERVANAIDEDLLALSPERDTDMNPARQLRTAVADACVIHTSTPEFQAAAEVIARVWQRNGIPCFAADATVMESVSERVPDSGDLFHDPFLDSEGSMLRLKVVMWGVDHAPSVAFATATYAQHCPDTQLGRLATAARLIVRALAAAVFELHE